MVFANGIIYPVTIVEIIVWSLHLFPVSHFCKNFTNFLPIVVQLMICLRMTCLQVVRCICFLDKPPPVMAKEGSKSCQIIIPQNQVHRKSGIFPNPFPTTCMFLFAGIWKNKFSFWNRIKVHVIFSVHTVTEEFKNSNNHCWFWSCVRGQFGQGNCMIFA